MDDTRLTHHSKARGKERLGFNKKALKRMAEKAYGIGITRLETRGAFRRYLDCLFFGNNQEAGNIRIWGENVYVFCDLVLVTVFVLPREHRKTAIRIRRRKDVK